MPKKAFIGLLLACSCLTMACLCCPTNLLSYLLTATEQAPAPPEPPAMAPVVPLADSTVAVDQFPVCVNNLAQALDESENSSASGMELDDEFTLVTYTVTGDTISDPDFVSPLPDSLEPYREDTASQQQIWQFVVDVIPADQRTLVTNFVVFTDGAGNTLGSVEQTDDPHDWMLEMDIQDSKNFPDLSTTLIHEFAHLLTLNDSQMETDYRVFDNPDDPEIFEQEAANCPTYFMYEGCSYPDSYINTFFDDFWQDIFDEWKVINAETDEDALEEQLDSFYQEYADQFVSWYAATSPEEDVAESFMYFIFTPRPSAGSMADQKVLFFYDYPEMVSLRERILGNLCTYVDN